MISIEGLESGLSGHDFGFGSLGVVRAVSEFAEARNATIRVQSAPWRGKILGVRIDLGNHFYPAVDGWNPKQPPGMYETL